MWWVEWEGPPGAHISECLVPSRWNSLGRLRMCDFAGDVWEWSFRKHTPFLGNSGFLSGVCGSNCNSQLLHRNCASCHHAPSQWHSVDTNLLQQWDIEINSSFCKLPWSGCFILAIDNRFKSSILHRTWEAPSLPTFPTKSKVRGSQDPLLSVIC